LLGAAAPNTEEGTIAGNAIAAATAVELFKKSLRLSNAASLVRPFFIAAFLLPGIFCVTI
jgi:hypothetical protein